MGVYDKKKMSRFLISAFVLLSFSNVFGQGQSLDVKRSDGLSLGLGYIYSNSIYSEVEDNQLPMPLIIFKKGNFFINGLTLGYGFLSSGVFKADILIDGKFLSGGYEAEDSSTLIGMDERKGTVMGGGRIKLRLWKFKFKAKLLTDLAETHNGIEGKIDVGIGFPINILFKKMPLTLIGTSFGYQYNSGAYNNYYFGVKETEALSNRSSYFPEKSWNPIVSTFVRVTISNKWSFMASYKRNLLPDEIKNSPIVDKTNKSTIVSFLSYMF